jgi:hypothetical protein
VLSYGLSPRRGRRLSSIDTGIGRELSQKRPAKSFNGGGGTRWPTSSPHADHRSHLLFVSGGISAAAPISFLSVGPPSAPASENAIDV